MSKTSREKRLESALTWIEHNAPGGLVLVARALSETAPSADRDAGGCAFYEGEPCSGAGCLCDRVLLRGAR